MCVFIETQAAVSFAFIVHTVRSSSTSLMFDAVCSYMAMQKGDILLFFHIRCWVATVSSCTKREW